MDGTVETAPQTETDVRGRALARERLLNTTIAQSQASRWARRAGLATFAQCCQALAWVTYVYLLSTTYRVGLHDVPQGNPKKECHQ